MEIGRRRFSETVVPSCMCRFHVRGPSLWEDVGAGANQAISLVATAADWMLRPIGSPGLDGKRRVWATLQDVDDQWG